MKIVLVIDQFDDSNNGTTVTARRFAGQLRRRGHEVVILAGGAPCEGKICAPVHRIPVFQKLIESQGMCFAKPDEEAYYTAFKDADIVHFYMPFRFCRRGEELARQMGIPTVAAFTCNRRPPPAFFWAKNRRVNDFLYWWFYKVFYNRFHHIHCPSAAFRPAAGELRLRREVVGHLNGVADAFRPAQVPHRSWRERFTILMIGRLSGEKRQDPIARGTPICRQAPTGICGQGPQGKRHTAQVCRGAGASARVPSTARTSSSAPTIPCLPTPDISCKRWPATCRSSRIRPATGQFDAADLFEGIGQQAGLKSRSSCAGIDFALCAESLFIRADADETRLYRGSIRTRSVNSTR